MTRFFDRFNKAISLSLDDVLPSDTATEQQKKRAVYESCIKNIGSFASDAALRSFREKARTALLTDSDFGQLNTYFESVQQETDKTVNTPEEVHAYSLLKTLCLHIAQILFLNSAAKEGLRIADFQNLASALFQHIILAEPRLDRADAQFYAEMFLHQVAFDLLFVTIDPPGTYDVNTGTYKLCDNYEKATEYLDHGQNPITCGQIVRAQNVLIMSNKLVFGMARCSGKNRIRSSLKRVG